MDAWTYTLILFIVLFVLYILRWMWYRHLVRNRLRVIRSASTPAPPFFHAMRTQIHLSQIAQDQRQSRIQDEMPPNYDDVAVVGKINQGFVINSDGLPSYEQAVQEPQMQASIPKQKNQASVPQENTRPGRY